MRLVYRKARKALCKNLSRQEIKKRYTTVAAGSGLLCALNVVNLDPFFGAGTEQALFCACRCPGAIISNTTIQPACALMNSIQVIKMQQKNSFYLIRSNVMFP